MPITLPENVTGATERNAMWDYLKTLYADCVIAALFILCLALMVADII